MNQSNTVEILSHTVDLQTIVHICIQILLYGLGTFIQIKYIKVCKTERNKTWQIHISHAIFMTTFFAVRIAFMAVALLSPNIFLDAGNWICFTFAFVNGFGMTSIAANTLIVSIMKYIFIVHTWKARSIGEDNIKKIFLFVNFALPFILALNFVIAFDFRHTGILRICFNSSIEKDPTPLYPSINDVLALDEEKQTSTAYLQLILGIFNRLAVFLIGSNLVEALFYFMIFRTMKR